MRSHRLTAGVLVFAGVVAVWGTAAWAQDAAKKVDPSGTWKWTTERGGETRESTIKLATKDGKLTGTFQTGELKADVAKATIEGDKVSFDVAIERDGQTFTLTFAGKLNKEQDAIEGTISFNQGNEREWTAKRVVEPEDVAGTWQLKIAFGDQTFEPTLVIVAKDGKLSGKYESNFGEMEIKEMAIKGQELLFTIERERDGQKSTIKYKAKPRGDSITGTMEYEFGDRTGTAEFEGKRAAAK